MVKNFYTVISKRLSSKSSDLRSQVPPKISNSRLRSQDIPKKQENFRNIGWQQINQQKQNINQVHLYIFLSQ